MSVYLDIGVVRVQRYIGRWPSLRGRRAASTMLSRELSLTDELQAVLGERAVLNPEGGAVDSVLSLKVTQGDPRAIATDVVAHLRTRLPSVELDANWAEAPDYVSAYPVMRAQGRSGLGLSSVPLGCSFPVLKLCDLCGIDAATRKVDLAGGTRAACLDCGLRAAVATEPPVECRLFEATGLAIADDFEALAQRTTSKKRNHLAHVIADGNAFGAFFAALATFNLPKEQVSTALHEAAWLSLVEATQAVSVGNSHVLPHVLGGDDILVTVPADHGWLFTRTFLRGFNDRVAVALQQLREAEGDRVPHDLPVPTASAAIVIAHQSHPFHSAVELAEQLLRKAKVEGKGRASAIAWLDVTRRGDDAGKAFQPILCDTLEQWSDAVEGMSGLSTAARHNLEEILGGPNERDAKVQAREFARKKKIVDTVFRTDLGISEVDEIARVLDIARWWKAGVSA
jgi:hypothetical protein